MKSNYCDVWFVTTTLLPQVKLGVTVGVAIALHNIPEGLCIALPVYFATGSKWEGLKLATLSGIAEPLGAMIVGLLMPSLLSEVNHLDIDYSCLDSFARV